MESLLLGSALAIFGFMIWDVAGLVVGGLFGILAGQLLVIYRRLAVLEAKLVASLAAPAQATVSSVKRVIPTKGTATTAAPLSATAQWLSADAGASTASASVMAPTAIDTFFENAYHFCMTKIKTFFTTGNLFARLGIVTLFLGISFLMTYVAQRGLMPIEWRLTGSAIFAVVLLGIGWRLRHKTPEYGLLLQGGGLGILYLITFMAYRLYHLIPSSFSFALFVLLTGAFILMSLLQDSRTLAIVAVLAGFLAPILASSGNDNHIVLFSYYAILNAGIFIIAWFKAWRPINLLGFFFTWAIGIVWGVTRYSPDHYLSSQLFLMLFFVFYVGITVCYAFRQAPQIKRFIDSVLIFGTPLIAFSLQIGLVSDYHYGIALSSSALGLFYMTLAYWILSRQHSGLALLSQVFAVLAVLFATIAIPLAFDNQWAAMTWALEGAAIIWLSSRQDYLLGRLLGTLLQLIAGFLFYTAIPELVTTPFLNGEFFSNTTLGLAGLISSYIYFVKCPQKKPFEQSLCWFLLAWGLLWWSNGFIDQFQIFLLPAVDLPHYLQFFLGNHEQPFYYALLSFATFTAIFAWIGKEYLQWDELRYVAMLLLPAMFLVALLIRSNFPHDFLSVAWIFAFAGWYCILYRHDRTPAPYLTTVHALGFFLLTLQLIVHARYWLSLWVPDSQMLSISMRGIVPALLMMGILTQGKRLSWPLVRHEKAYYGVGCCGLGLLVAGWIFFSSARSGDDGWLTYWPLLNPLDIGAMLGLASLVLWTRRDKNLKLVGLPLSAQQRIYIFESILGFIWINAVLLRSLHHFAGIPYEWYAMYESQSVQMSLSIFWTSLALLGTIFASMRNWRSLWIAGAVLIGLIFTKLLFIDLADSGTISRIVSFIVVGLFLLLMGYFAPIPPRGK